MRIGVVFPQTELGGDVGAVRAYGEGVQELGFTHVLAYDHVVGADPDVHRGWRGPYDVSTTFHEPFVLFGYLAAVTSLELVTGIIILPQRQTVLAAKQAAEVDLLTDGHFRLGVGIGWNAVEYEALGKDFSNRGARLEEQVALLRRLWTERTVTHEGVHERVDGRGAGAPPRATPDPGLVRGGGRARPATRRAARRRLVPAGAARPQARRGARDRAAARPSTPAAIPTPWAWRAGSAGSEGDLDKLVRQAGRWRDADATHLSVNTMAAGLASVDDHLAALAKAADALAPLDA